jgi:CheY-like chemotaxis protein
MIILYAEDDPEDVDIFREAIKTIDESIACIIAKDGAEAIDALENSIILPDIVFLDVNMPMVGGRDCLIHIKSNKMLRSIPVIMYTTSTRQHDMNDFKALGASDYIIKPNTFEEVSRCLGRILLNTR